MFNKVKIKVKHLEHQGKKFDAYKAVLNDGTMIDARFTKEAKETSKNGLPTANCFIYVEPTNMNVSHKKEYPVLWIQKIEAIEYLADVKVTQGVEEIEELFGKPEEKLPF